MNDQTAASPQQDGAQPPPQAEAKQANGEAWNGLLRLRKPVVANGDTVSEITFREPTGGDIERVGNPVTFSFENNSPKVHMEAATMTQMMAFLAGVPPSTIRQLHPRDWNNGAWMLAGFFTPDLFV